MGCCKLTEQRFPEFQGRFNELRQGYKSQKEFAEFLGISRPTVGFYENGDRFPDALALKNIAKKCNVSADWLLGLTDVKTTDADLKAVCEYTGLSEMAIKTLRAMKADDQTIEKYVPSKWYGDLRMLDEILCDKTHLWSICHDLAQIKLMKDVFSTLEQRNINLKISEYRELRELIEEKTEGMAYIAPYSETIKSSYASALSDFIMLVEKLTDYTRTISKYDNLWVETYEKLFVNERGESNAET